MLVFNFPIIIFIFTYFICHVRHKLNVMYVIKLDAIIFFLLCSYWKKLSTVLISINRVFFQCIHFKFVKYFQRKFYLYLLFLKRQILWCHVRHAILNSYYDHMEDVRFYTLDSFFFLRILFDIFNAAFHFCYLKSKFCGGFPSKISFWMSRTPHENGPIAYFELAC